MASIIGEKSKYKNAMPNKRWHNAEDLASINALIDAKTAQLNEVTALLTEAMEAITAGGNSHSGCTASPICNRRHISSWREIRDRNALLVEKYKKELAELLALQEKISVTQTTNAVANKALADADTAGSAATASKVGLYALIAGVAIAVIIGGIILYKKFKK